MKGTVDAILMASGLSRRFGDADKLLADFGGEPLALRTLRLALSIGAFTRVLFVAANPAVLRLSDGLAAEAIHNSNPERGACESIRLGVCASGAENYLFFTCDQPLLDAETIRRLLEKADGVHIVSPAYGGQPGSPVLFPASLRGELLELRDGESGRTVKRRHPQLERIVPIQNPHALMDIDRPEDAEILLRIYRGES